MKKILLFLGVLVLTLGLCVGIGNATLHTVITDSSIVYQDEEGNAVFTINEDTVIYGTTVYDATILMDTTDQVQFWDTGLHIGATADGALALNSDGTLVTTVTTSYTLTVPIVTITATTRLDHQYDSTNYVRQTVSSAGVVKVLTVGSSDSYEIETEDGAITLDADTGIALDAGDSVITITGDIDANNAAGPSIIDETVTATNPTLCPNKVEDDTGLGWESDTIHIVLGGVDEYDFSTSALEMNANNLTEVGTYAGTGAITISPGAAGTFLDFVLETEWVGGTLINVDWASTTEITQTTVFVNLDCANVTATSEESITAIDINLPQMTISGETKTAKGIEITAQGAMVWSSSGTGTWTGVDVTIPAITEGASTTVLATGLKITGQTITTNGDVYGLLLAGVFTSGIQIGLDGTELDLVLYTDRGLSIYNKTDATGGNVMSMYVEMISSGACKARAAEFVLAPTAQMGQWANAVKAYLNLLDAPGSAGTASGLCVEVLFPDEQQTSSVTVLELEAVVNTNYLYSTYTSVILFQLSGTDSSSFQDGAYFLYVGGLTAATDDMWFNNTLKCRITDADWYLPFSSAQGSYTSAYIIDITNTTDASAIGTAAIISDGGISCADELWLGDDLDMSSSGDGVYDLTLKTDVADALSITDGTDIIVFKTSAARMVTITPALTVTGNIISDSTTEATSSTGAIQTDGGISVTKQLFLQDDIDMTTSGSGVYELTLKDDVADALSITREGTDMILFKTSASQLITITPATTITGALTANGGISTTTVGTTGKVTITPGAAGTFLDFVLGSSWLGGTLVNVDCDATVTPTQAVVGFNMDLGANLAATAEQNVKAIDINLPTMTIADVVLATVKGVEITWAGAVTIDSGEVVSVGIDIDMPAVTETSGTLTSTGIDIAGGTLTSGDAYGIVLSGTFTTGISLDGTFKTAAISMDSATFAALDNEIEMRNTVTGDKTIIASGSAADDAAIRAAVGADADIADGSLYMQIVDGAGALYIKKNDEWVAFSNP